jgi:hypothetical protein
MSRSKQETIAEIVKLLESMGEAEVALVNNIIRGLSRAYEQLERPQPDSLIDETFVLTLGNLLKNHHAVSEQPLSKDKFEFAFLSACRASAHAAQLVNSRTNPGNDITVDGVPISLKTEAARNIQVGTIHISKFRELGKGHWETLEDLVALRQQFFDHMRAYERIFTLRCFHSEEGLWHYELVEIPKALLLEAEGGRLYFIESSTQTPKPANCDVVDEKGNLKFQLYFDAGTERKLQVRRLNKSLCFVRAVWVFRTNDGSNS